MPTVCGNETLTREDFMKSKKKINEVDRDNVIDILSCILECRDLRIAQEVEAIW